VTPVKAALRRPLGSTPRRRPAGAARVAPPGRMSNPARAEWIAPSSQKQEEELAGMLRSIPLAKKKKRPPPRGLGSRGPR